MSCHLGCKFLLHVLRFIKIIGFNSIMKNFQLSKVYRFKVILNYISNCQFCPLQLLRKWCICKNIKWRQSIIWTSKNIGPTNEPLGYTTTFQNLYTSNYTFWLLEFAWVCMIVMENNCTTLLCTSLLFLISYQFCCNYVSLANFVGA